MDIAEYIDHTLLKATATETEILQLCSEAIQYNFFSVCVNSCYVKHCRNTLHAFDNNISAVKITSVAGFPLGAMDFFSKLNEAENAIKDGADEIDMVMNIGFLRSKNYNAVETEIKRIKEAIGHNVLKVIIETGYLSDAEKTTASKIILNAGADFVKTSTGFGSGGATLDDIALIRRVTEDKIMIKASGGIRDYKTAIQFIEAGVSRIGTSSSVAIIEEQNQQL